MKSLVRNHKYTVSVLLALLIVFGIFSTGNVQAQNIFPRTVNLFYLLPNDRPYRQEVVDAMKTGILEVQSFYADQMEAHGYGRMTFTIQTAGAIQGKGDPAFHRVNSPHPASHYESNPIINEVEAVVDTHSIVQLIVVDARAGSVGGHGVGIKQRGKAVIYGEWNSTTAIHELGHAFGLQHDFRDDTYTMSYGGGRSTLSAGAAHFLAVNPYFNSSVPLQAESAPTVELISSTNYLYGVVGHVAGQPVPALHVPVTLRVRDPDGIQQVSLYVKTPDRQSLSRPSGFLEVIEHRNLSGQTDTTITFNYEGNTPSFGDTNLLNTLKHTIYVSAIDKQGNRIEPAKTSGYTLQAINIPKPKVPLSERSPRVAESIYEVVRRFHDRSVSSYDHILQPHLDQITNMFVNNIRASDSALQANDFDGLPNLSRLELRFESGYSDSTLLPAGIFKGLTSLSSVEFRYYKRTYGDDPTLYPILPFPVGLKKVGEGQFKAVVHTGALSDMELPLIVVNGSINGGATSVTIPTGSVESDILTVTRTPGTTAAVIVDLERVVASPEAAGYVFYKSSYHLELFSPLAGAPTAVTQRTPQVIEAIVGEVPEINHIHHERDLRYMINGKFVDKKYNTGHYVSEAHLAAITSLNAVGGSGTTFDSLFGGLAGNWFRQLGDITALKLGDFDGMTNLKGLYLSGNKLSSLPNSIFDKLTNLKTLDLSSNELSSLPAGLFDKLTNLTGLSLFNNDFSSLQAGIFDKLTNLKTLNLSSNELSSLPAGLFDKLTNLTYLNLLENPLRSLPDGYFDKLTNLKTLLLPRTITPPQLPKVDKITSVADRTPKVRAAIVAAVGVNSAANVTAGHLAAITELDLSESGITALKSGDFDNLTGLETLGVGGTFSSLPDGIFDHLVNLKNLGLLSSQLRSLPDGLLDQLTRLWAFAIGDPESDDAIAKSPLRSLPDGIFDNCTNLSFLHISGTQLSSLPDGIFDNFTNVPFMILSNNQLSSLPDGIFDKATMILDLSNNQLSSLPDGIFKGIFDTPPDLTGFNILGAPGGPIPKNRLAELGEYTTLNLTGNLVDPLPFTISLERVGNGQFKAVAPAGALFELMLPIRVANGTITGGATSITIPVGRTESETFTVTRTPGTTLAVSVNIETLPKLWRKHSGYALVKSADLPLVFTEFGGEISPISGRTPEVRDAIVREVPGVNSAAEVTQAHLAAITELDVDLRNSVQLKAGDFDGLTGLTELELIIRKQLTSIPAGLFNDLSNVTDLDFRSGDLTTLPAGMFNGLTNVTTMSLSMRQLTSLPDGIFDPFTNLTEVEMEMPQLTSLPAGIFDELTNLTTLGFSSLQLTSLPAGIFDELTNLTVLSFYTGQLTSLPDGIFDRLTNLTHLYFSTGQLTSLSDNLFNQLSNLTDLGLSGSQIQSLLDGIKWPTTLTNLGLYSTQLSTLPDGVFDGLPALTTLNLNNNNLTSLPPDIFSELPNLTRLLIRDNQLSALPDGVFSGLSSLTSVSLSRNAVDPLRLTVLLEKVGTDQFKAVAPAGAPFDIVLPISVKNGSINGGAKHITIPTGSVESQLLTVTRTSGPTAAATTVNIGTLPGLPANHSGYAVVRSSHPPLDFSELVGPAITPVSQRTPAVRDAIVRVARVNSASDVTDAHLAAIRQLNLSRKNITALKSGDFGGLSSLIFLDLEVNDLTTLPDDIFTGLFSLVRLRLYLNDLTTLPDGVFDDLSSLRELHLSNNDLTTLPADIFDDLSSLTELNLYNNNLTSLPDGVFSNLSSLTRLWLQGNTVDPLPLTVSLEKVADGEFKAVVPTGAPFEMELPLTVTNGSISGATSITIPIGSVESKTFTVTRTPGTIASVTVDIGTLPELPTNTHDSLGYRLHQGYTLVKSTDLPLAVISGTNTAPVFTDSPSTTRAIAENTAAGQNIGTAIATTDADSGDTLTYTLGGTDAASFTIVSTTGQLQTSAALDHETDDAYSVTVSVSDSNGGTDSIDVAISVTDANDAPVFTNGTTTTRAIAENTASGQNIGTAVAATDQDGDTITYTLSGTDATSFSIVSTSGQLQTSAALDYETKPSYSVTVTASDGTLTDTITVTINVSNVNETPSFIDGSSATRSVEENTASGTNIGTPIAATDADSGDTLTYTLSGTNAASFSIVSTSGQLQTKAALDYETKTSYSVTVSVSDSNGGSDSITVTINVTDVNDTVIVPPSVPVAARTSQVRDAIVAAIPGVSDANQVTPAHLAAITSLNLRNAGITALQVDDFSGMTALTDLNLFNNQLSRLPIGIFEGLTSLTTIRLGRNAIDPFPLTVSLEKVGEGAFKAVAPAGATFNYVLPITVANGTINGGATTLIIPHGRIESGTLTVTRPPGTTGHVMVDIAAFPRLPRTHYGYTLVKSDNLPLAAIRGINTPPAFSDGTTATRSIAENTVADTNIGTPITATDADNDRLTYTLSGTDAAAFSIDSTTGQLRTKAALDYETKAAYAVTVAVSDGYGGSDSIPVTINVTDVIENRAPVFTEGNSITRTIAENTAANINIGTAIAATDADNDRLTYTLSGTDASSFAINRNTGQLRTKAALDYEAKRSYSVTVTVSDGRLTDTITVTINITDVAENRAPVFADGSTTTRTIAENTAARVNIGSAVTATDADNDTLTYTLSGTDAAAFDINRTTGQLQTKAALDYETKVTYTVTVSVSDGNGGSDSITVTITVTDVNENQPPVFTDGATTTRTIAENTAANINIGTAIAATDADNDTLTYTLSGTDAAAFSIISTSGQLQTKAALDYETKNSYRVTITVSDGSLTDTISVTVNITDVDEGPADTPGGDTPPPTTDTRIAFEANTPPGYTRVTLNATGTVWGIPTKYTTDSNVGTVAYMALAKLMDCNFADAEVARQSIVYIKRQSLGKLNNFASEAVCGTTSRTWASPWNGVRITHLRFFHETRLPNVKEAVYNPATDQIELPGAWQPPPGNTTNTAPVFADGTSTTRTIAENTAAGIHIGLAVTATDTDNDVLTYTLSGRDAATFGIDATTGQLKTKAALDYETKTTYTVTVTVTDGSLTDIITVTINITDINELPTTTAICKVGDVLAPGESCTYPGTDAVFSVLDNGSSQWKIPNFPWLNQVALGGSMSFTADINNENYHFVAKEVSNNSWEIEAIGDDTNQQPEQPGDTGGTLTLRASTAAPLTEAILDESVITLTLIGRKFERWDSVIRPAVSVSGISGVTVRSYDIDRESDTEVTLELTYDGNMTSNGTLTLTVGADAIAGYNGPALTAQIAVSASTDVPITSGGTPTLTASTTSPLAEATLHDSIVTLTLTGGRFADSDLLIEDAVSLSGIAGVTIKDVDRESNTELEIELAFNGNLNADSTLTFTVGAGAIAGYNGPALTDQVSVSASTETPVDTGGQNPDPPERSQQPVNIGGTPTLTASTTSALTEATLDESVVTLTLSGRIYVDWLPSEAVTVSGINGVTFSSFFGVDRINDTQITVELAFNGDFDTDAILTFTVKPSAIAGYDGPALTTQITVTADRENALLANFPNPFNPETWIPYQLAEPAKVSITIHAINGQVVRQLAIGHQAAGIYQNRSRAAYWDGRNEFGEPVASGVYFYTLSTESTRDSVTAGDFSATRKMLIRK